MSEIAREIGGTIYGYLKQHRLTIGEAAEILGVSRPTLSSLIHGHSKLSISMAKSLQRRFKINGLRLLQRQLDEDYHEN